MIYRASPPNGPLRQGEVLSGVIQHTLAVETFGTEELEVVPVEHPFAIIASQDCDLEQDFASADGVGSALPSTLMFEVIPITTLVAQIAAGRDIRKRILQNVDLRYHVMEAIPNNVDAAKEGIASIGIDFKRYFTVPTRELYAQLAHGCRRRSILESPYLEHFAARATAYNSRIALPADHVVTDPLQPQAAAAPVAGAGGALPAIEAPPGELPAQAGPGTQ